LNGQRESEHEFNNYEKVINGVDRTDFEGLSSIGNVVTSEKECRIIVKEIVAGVDVRLDVGVGDVFIFRSEVEVKGEAFAFYSMNDGASVFICGVVEIAFRSRSISVLFGMRVASVCSHFMGETVMVASTSYKRCLAVLGVNEVQGKVWSSVKKVKDVRKDMFFAREVDWSRWFLRLVEVTEGGVSSSSGAAVLLCVTEVFGVSLLDEGVEAVIKVGAKVSITGEVGFSSISVFVRVERARGSGVGMNYVARVVHERD